MVDGAVVDVSTHPILVKRKYLQQIANNQELSTSHRLSNLLSIGVINLPQQLMQ